MTRFGGAIVVTSGSGAGTMFDIYLPSVAPAWESPPVVAEPVEEGGGEVAGYSVHEAAGAEEAASFCATFANPLHLIIMDMVIPHKNEPELVTELRTLRGDFAVLFISGYAEETA